MNPTITISATYTPDNKPQSFAACGPERASREAAEADLDFFPKMTKFVVARVGFFQDGQSGHYFQIRTSAALAANGVNGGVNETGVKRYRAVVRNAPVVAWKGDEFVNNYSTRDAFEAAL